MRTVKPTSDHLCRRGITALEVIVALIVLAALFVVYTLWVQSSRETCRRKECLNNLYRMGLAVTGYASGQNDKLPFLEDGTEYGSWCRQILVYLDNSALDRGIQNGIDPSDVSMKVFLCCDDRSKSKLPGGLSYVANAGFISHDLWGRPGDHRYLHIFWV